MRDYDKEPLILENKFGKHMDFMAKLNIISIVLMTIFIITRFIIDPNYNPRRLIGFSTIYMLMFNYKKFRPFKNSKIIFYNDKIECISQEFGFLNRLNLKDITDIQTCSGIKLDVVDFFIYLKRIYRHKMTDNEKRDFYVIISFLLIILFSIAIYHSPMRGIFVFVYFISFFIIQFYGLNFLKNLSSRNTIEIHNNQTFDSIQLAFLDKNEQNLLKEYFMKRCKKLINFS